MRSIARFAFFVLLFGLLLVPDIAHAGGSLERIQSSHSSSSSRSGSSSSSSSLGASSSGSSAAGAVGEVVLEKTLEGIVRLIGMTVYYTGSRAPDSQALSPEGPDNAAPRDEPRVWRQPSRDPYDSAGPYAPFGEDQAPARRWLEVGTDTTGFAAGIIGARGVASFSLASVRVEGQYMRLWEPDASRVMTLDTYSVNAGLNLLGATNLPAELYLKLGVSGITGATGFGYGFDTRVYPARPLVIHGAFDATSFANGAPLIFARFGPGVAFGRFEARLEGTLMHQARVVTTYGPTISLAARF
jgi:hypothetical protein